MLARLFGRNVKCQHKVKRSKEINPYTSIDWRTKTCAENLPLFCRSFFGRFDVSNVSGLSNVKFLPLSGGRKRHVLFAQAKREGGMAGVHGRAFFQGRLFAKIAPSPLRSEMLVIGSPSVPSGCSGRNSPPRSCLVAVSGPVPACSRLPRAC